MGFNGIFEKLKRWGMLDSRSSDSVEQGFQNGRLAQELHEESQHAFFKSKIVKQGRAVRVLFFYPGDVGSYIDQADVTLFENGMVHIVGMHEESTVHMQNCEIVWRMDPILEGQDLKLADASLDKVIPFRRRTETSPN